MTDGQWYAVAGALRELMVIGGMPENALEADEKTQRLVMPLEGGRFYGWDLTSSLYDAAGLDHEELARAMYDEFRRFASHLRATAFA